MIWEDGDLFSEEIRGIDDAIVNGELMLVVIDRDGKVVLFNEGGQVLWEYTSQWRFAPDACL